MLGTGQDRRSFLKFLAASPLLASIPLPERALAQATSLQGVDALIANTADGLDVFDFEAVAARNIPPAHWGYLQTGVDGDETLRANREAFAQYQLRERRMVDVSKMDMGVELFGARYDSPIFMCPLGAQKAFHPEAEVAVARAAKVKNQLQVLSTVASLPIEDVARARVDPLWFQLYPTNSLDVSIKLAKRAEAAGCPVMMVTVDLTVGRNTETATRFLRTDTRQCTSCHSPRGSDNRTRAMFSGIDMSNVGFLSPSLSWDFIGTMKDATRMKVLIKGLETGEDAALAVKYGADGVVVSNHGGRASETGRGTLECLPEVVSAVKGRIPVLVDGGVRRGTDALKALALGATAVGIGRPYIWGLGAFGQPGVERVLGLLNNELRLAMAGVGARNVKEITPKALIRKA
ncbi:MAG: alpha-hydroxy-acid oxidizing protein [Alphaproteobacteria bacterium]|nr:alpha-hydroxy-acid oxidizing protein [Alphaproteobacteria bacterium]